MDLPIGFSYTELTIIKAALESELGEFISIQVECKKDSPAFNAMEVHIKQRMKIIETIEQHFIKYRK